MPGWRQRLRERERSPPRALPNDFQSSALCCSLLKDWCLGKLSTPEVTKHCRAEVRDQPENVHPAIKFLSTVDARQGNRDLFKKLKGIVVESNLIEKLLVIQLGFLAQPHDSAGHPELSLAHYGQLALVTS